MPLFQFPADFVWGTATAAYQIEGGATTDGRGPSIWDTFSRQPGAVVNGDTGDIACDHYNRWEEDLDLLVKLGIRAYRFSIAWPRIQPNGRGPINPKGLGFYSRLVDGMLQRGITPFCTLYHWDLPQALEDEGGWRVRSTAEAYADYAAIVARALGDRITHWATFNEMPCIVNLGYRIGIHAPGARETEQVIRQVNHHVLLAHGLGVQAIRSVAPHAKVGIVHNTDNIDMPEPATDAPDDIAAARGGYVACNSWMLDPIFLGKYPEREWAVLGPNVPNVADGDLKIINQPLDFLGINAYSSGRMASAERGLEQVEAHYPKTHMDWNITGDCLYWATRFAHERYAPKSIFITENGCAWPDVPDPATGDIIDYSRIMYLRAHLRGVHRAIAEGLPLRGYFLWSFLDNYEWSWGYTRRFGIVHLDYPTQRRTPKLSAKWYSKVIGQGHL